ncbi:MAG: zinc ribbon domain-containing protein [Chthoniobacter sp.]
MSTNPPAPAPTLLCEQCGYANEPERVYCHNCGAKLDRSLLPKAAEKAQENPEVARKRIAKMTNPKSGAAGREIKTLFKVAFYSAAIAAIFLILQQPEDLPEVKKGSESQRMINSDMMEALGSPTPARVSFSDDDINSHLKRAMNKPKDTMVPGIQVVRAYVACVPGVLRLYSEQSTFGYPTFSRIDYKLEVKDGKFIPTIVGGAFGKLAIDPQLMQYADYAFGTLFDSLAREHKQMDKMLSVSVQQGRIDLVTKGMNAPR